MGISDKSGFPVSVSLASASPHELSLVETAVADRLTRNAPVCLVGDKAYDSDRHDTLLQKAGITLIAPHKNNHRKIPTQDGRQLRRYRRRYRIERLFAWLKNYRRIIIRYEVKSINFLGFVHLAVLLILLRKY